MNGQMITLYEGDQHIPVVWTHLIPATLEGQAKFNVANALAATAIASGLGIPIDNIRQGLRTFAMTFYQAPGRLNIFDELGFRVIVDYAHNPAAMRAMGELIKGMRQARKIGVLSAPGDRRDVDIHELGQIAATIFDELIIKEDKGLRGRKPGETAGLLREGAIEAGKASSHITVISDELEAVEAALQGARPEELVVIFADDIIAVWKRVTKWRR
jgi:cyanophycin synthetase